MEDYTTRTIEQDEKGYYRTYNGKRIDTDCNGDVYLEIPLQVFTMAMPGQMRDIIRSFYPSLGEVISLSDVFVVKGDIAKIDDVSVCFKTGIYGLVNPVYDDDCYVISGYNRTKHPSDFEFNQFMSMAAEDFSNVFLTNPYQEDVEI